MLKNEYTFIKNNPLFSFQKNEFKYIPDGSPNVISLHFIYSFIIIMVLFFIVVVAYRYEIEQEEQRLTHGWEFGVAPYVNFKGKLLLPDSTADRVFIDYDHKGI